MMKKVLMLNGSPHEKGCTYTALRELERALQKHGIGTEIHWLGKAPVAGWTSLARSWPLRPFIMQGRAGS